MNTKNRPYFGLVAIFLVGAIAGFLVKAAIKAKVTSSPDDRKITAVKQTFDFKAAQDNVDKQDQASQAQQDQGVPSDQAAPGDQGAPVVPGQ
jgi:hypothetical protein